MRLFAMVILSVGCATTGAPEVDDREAPVLEVTSPARGTVTDDGGVEVAGRVSDDRGRVRLEIDGELVNPSQDGSFRHRLDLDPGFHLIETVATDAAGNAASDIRALVVGELIDGADGADKALRAHVGQDQLDVVSAVIADQIGAVDFGALLSASNPVFSTGGGCFRASVDVENVDFGAVAVTSQALSGALQVEVAVDDVHADLLADYRLSCLGGKQSIDVDADRIIISGELVLDVVDGRVVAVLEDAEVASEGLDADIGLAPLEPLVDAIDQIVFDKLAAKLEGQLADQVAGLIDQGINRAYTLSFDGIDFRYRIAPTYVGVQSTGLGFDASVRAWVDGASDVPFVGSTTSLPTLAEDGVSLAVSDDAVGHVISVLWNAGVFDRGFDVAELGVFPGLSSLELELTTAPMVGAGDDGVRMAVADARVSLYSDRSGSEELVAVLSASAVVLAELGADEEGGIEVDLDLETLSVQILEERPIANDIIDLDTIEALAGAAIAVVLSDTSRKLSDLELPAILGVELLVQDASSGKGGAVLAGQLQAP